MINYVAIYDQVYTKNPGYSAKDNSPCLRYWEKAWALLPPLPDMPGQVVDIGGGQGLLKDKIPKAKYSVLDVSMEALKLVDKGIISVIQADLTGMLPYSAMSIKFDLGYCFDVLEHIQSDHMPRAISNLRSITPKLIGSISMRPASNTDYLGRNLHLTVEGSQYWQGMLQTQYKQVIVKEDEDQTLLFAATD